MIACTLLAAFAMTAAQQVAAEPTQPEPPIAALPSSGRILPAREPGTFELFGLLTLGSIDSPADPAYDERLDALRRGALFSGGADAWSARCEELELSFDLAPAPKSIALRLHAAVPELHAAAALEALTDALVRGETQQETRAIAPTPGLAQRLIETITLESIGSSTSSETDAFAATCLDLALCTSRPPVEAEALLASFEAALANGSARPQPRLSPSTTGVHRIYARHSPAAKTTRVLALAPAPAAHDSALDAVAQFAVGASDGSEHSLEHALRSALVPGSLRVDIGREILGLDAQRWEFEVQPDELGNAIMAWERWMRRPLESVGGVQAAANEIDSIFQRFAQPTIEPAAVQRAADVWCQPDSFWVAVSGADIDLPLGVETWPLDLAPWERTEDAARARVGDMLQALGGREAWQQVEALRVRSETTLKIGARTLTVPAVSERRFEPHAMRTTQEQAGREIRTLLVGSRGWRALGDHYTPLSAEDAERTRDADRRTLARIVHGLASHATHGAVLEDATLVVFDRREPLVRIELASNGQPLRLTPIQVGAERSLSFVEWTDDAPRLPTRTELEGEPLGERLSLEIEFNPALTSDTFEFR